MDKLEIWKTNQKTKALEPLQEIRLLLSLPN